MVTAKLAEFIVSAVPNDGARAMMRMSLFDWAICGYAGRNEPVVRIVRDMVMGEGGEGQAVIFGVRRRIPARGAALVNATAAHALEYDESHFNYTGHPTVMVIPAALAVSERDGADGRRMIEAAVIGAEVSIRVGEWLGWEHSNAGYDQTATAGTFGATAAACRVMGLNVQQVTYALSIAASRAAGLKSAFGTMGAAYQAGLAAAAGVEAATLAAAGFVARPDALSCDLGFGATHSGEGRMEALEDLGESWHFDWITHKYHACCHGAHAMLEALDSLGPRLAGQTVEAVEVFIHPSWLTVCNIAAPDTGLQAKFSLRLIAAMMLDGQDTRQLDSFSAETCKSPSLVALRDKVTVHGDAALSASVTRVAVRLAGGKRIEAVHDVKSPIPLPVRATRLRGKARALLGDPILGPFWAALTRSEVPDLNAFTHFIAGHFPPPVAAAE